MTDEPQSKYQWGDYPWDEYDLDFQNWSWNVYASHWQSYVENEWNGREIHEHEVMRTTAKVQDGV